MPKYTVQQGDCVTNIASASGLPWKILWNHPENAPLRQLRKDPNVLYPGDEIFIPERTVRLEQCATDKKHTFELKDTGAKIKLRLLDADQPRANQPYRLEIDGATVASGQTDGDGIVAASIPPRAVEAILYVGTGEARDVYPLHLGNLDPIETDEGVGGRLLCLGYATENIEEAITAFQQKHGLSVTGSADAATRAKLEERFGQ
jgi:N-acetylmuramoyl-L-alanine amidase